MKKEFRIYYYNGELVEYVDFFAKNEEEATRLFTASDYGKLKIRNIVEIS